VDKGDNPGVHSELTLFDQLFTIGGYKNKVLTSFHIEDVTIFSDELYYINLGNTFVQQIYKTKTS
jgi:hypothetical protein